MPEAMAALRVRAFMRKSKRHSNISRKGAIGGRRSGSPSRALDLAKGPGLQSRLGARARAKGWDGHETGEPGGAALDCPFSQPIVREPETLCPPGDTVYLRAGRGLRGSNEALCVRP